jgi:hypothetical protein
MEEEYLHANSTTAFLLLIGGIGPIPPPSGRMYIRVYRVYNSNVIPIPPPHFHGGGIGITLLLWNLHANSIYEYEEEEVVRQLLRLAQVECISPPRRRNRTYSSSLR